MFIMEKTKSFASRKRFIKKLYQKGHTFASIGKLLGITRQRVQKILKKIKGKEKDKLYYCKVCKEGFMGHEKKKRFLCDIHLNKFQGRDRVREAVRVRDNYTCQICFKKWRKGQRRFDVHHLDEIYEGKSNDKGIYQIDKNEIDRMITLCHKCHLNLESVKKKMKNGHKILSTG